MNDLELSITLTLHAIIFMVAGSLSTLLCCKYTLLKKEERKQEFDVDTSDPDWSGNKKLDWRLIIDRFTDGSVSEKYQTRDFTPLPEGLLELAQQKTIESLGYRKPPDAVCTSSTKLKPIPPEVPIKYDNQGKLDLEPLGKKAPQQEAPSKEDVVAEILDDLRNETNGTQHKYTPEEYLRKAQESVFAKPIESSDGKTTKNKSR
jgi:hypothetical protein